MAVRLSNSVAVSLFERGCGFIVRALLLFVCGALVVIRPVERAGCSIWVDCRCLALCLTSIFETKLEVAGLLQHWR